MNILTCERVRKVYGSGNNQVTALDGIDLTISKGEFVAIIGGIRLRKIHASAYPGQCGQAD